MPIIDEYINDFNSWSKTNYSDSFIEFELKLMLDPRIKAPDFIKGRSLNKCKDLFRFLTSNAKLVNKQTINFIYNDDKEDYKSYIKELVFENGIQRPDKKRFYEKKSLAKPIYICPVDNIGLKVSISEEKTSVDMKKYDLIRYKNRFEFNLNSWRADFTFIISSKSMDLETIKATRNKMFVGITSANIFTDKSAIWDFVDSIEIEFEYTSQIVLSTDAILIVKDLLLRARTNKIEPDNTNILYTLTRTLGIKTGSNDTLKQILPNAIEINKKQYFQLILKNIQDFYITDKVDGLRSILIINTNIAIFNTEYKFICPNTIFKLDETIIECELVNDHFYAYDIIKYDGCNISKNSFSDRLERLKSLTGLWHRLSIKKFARLTNDNYKQTIQNFVIGSKDGYNIDGIVFTSAKNNYMNTKFYKWKPVESMTIDFLAKRCPSSLLGITPYTCKEGHDLYLLFVGINAKEFSSLGLEKIRDYKYLFPTLQESYFPIQFAPSDNPMVYMFHHSVYTSNGTSNDNIDGRVVELRWADGWKLVRIRADRDNDIVNKNYYGNNYTVAELIWRNYSNPLTLELLCSDIDVFESEFYFKVDNSELYKNIRKYNNMVKQELLSHVTAMIKDHKNSWVIDLGCGKGQDLEKYMRGSCRNLVMIDNNETNLCSVIERKYKYINSSTSTNIYMKNLDINGPWKVNIDALIAGNTAFAISKTKLVICNFAIHYFIGSANNFINFVDALMPSKSRFMFTCFNGQKIFDLLKPSGKWGDGKKYSIVSKFNNEKFVGGEEIEILLPFSNGKLYKESLVNLALIERKLNKKKIMLESSGVFNSQKYIQLNKHKLTDMDLTYLGLLEYAIYHKK